MFAARLIVRIMVRLLVLALLLNALVVVTGIVAKPLAVQMSLVILESPHVLLHEVVEFPRMYPLHTGHFVVRPFARVLLLQSAPEDVKASPNRCKEFSYFDGISRLFPGLPLGRLRCWLVPISSTTWDVKLVAVVGQLHCEHGVALLHEAASMRRGSIGIGKSSSTVLRDTSNRLEAEQQKRTA